MEKVKLNPKRTKNNINISSVINSIRSVKASNSVETNNLETKFKKKGKSNRNSDSKILFLFNNKHTKTKPSTTIEDINHKKTKNLNQNSLSKRNSYLQVHDTCVARTVCDTLSRDVAASNTYLFFDFR